jgi:ATP-dependent RNA helicase
MRFILPVRPFLQFSPRPPARRRRTVPAGERTAARTGGDSRRARAGSMAPGSPKRRRPAGPREAETASFSTSQPLKVSATFESLALRPPLLRGLYAFGFVKPSAVQARALAPLLAGRDVVAQAQSGTGKTAMIALASLQLAAPAARDVQVLVVSPTRELALQTHRNIEVLGEYDAVKAAPCIGGSKVGEDMRRLEAGGVQVVSGTPGRVYDMVQRGVLDLKRLRTLVVDEADEMLGAGFKDQMYDIYRYVPSDAQVVLVSATLPPEVLDMTERFMTDPVSVLVKRDELTLAGIAQFYVDVEREEWKYDTLCDLYETICVTQAVIFCNSRKKVAWLADRMRAANFTVAAMHGDMDQAARNAVMAAFRNGDSRVLIATDMWSRGIDVAQVSLVVNYDLPRDSEAYLHRIGRSGRFGRKGLAVNLVAEADRRALKAIERFYGTRIREMPANVDKYM